MKWRTVAWIAAVLAVVVIVTMVLRAGSGASPVYESTTVERGTVRHVVSVTGHVEPIERIVLSFTAGGVLQGLTAKEGMRVAPGQEIARLDTGVYSSAIEEARARLLAERAMLNETLSPLRSEERALRDTLVVNAETTLARATESVRATLARVFTLADDAIHEKVDKLFAESRGVSPTFGIRFTAGVTEYLLRAGFSGPQFLNEGRAEASAILVRMYERMTSDEDPLTLLDATNEDLATLESFLTEVARAVNRYIPEDREAQAVYQLFQSTVSVARTSILNARADALNARREYEAAQAGLIIALRELELADAGASEHRIAAQQAAVIAAEQGIGGALERL